MNEIIKKSKDLNLKLKTNAMVEEFLKLRKEIENNNYLKEINDKKEFYKKEYCHSKDLKMKKEYLKYEKEYHDHILVIQYNNVKEDVFDLLNEMSKILS